MTVPARRRWRSVLLTLPAVALAACCCQPARLLVGAWWRDRPTPDVLPPNTVDDASRLNATRVAEVVDVASDPAAAEEQLRALLRRARAERLPVAVGGARHTMGGHSIAADGIAVNMLPFNRLSLDADRDILTAGAGARWSDVVPFLDARGRSVAVMQTTHDFSVGGSLSANCHGWQVGRPPIASTVESFRLMRPDGEVVRCSRAENADLFGLALGGYGLFGIILDAELRVVPNVRLAADPPCAVAADDCAAAFRERTADPGVAMAFARLDVTPGPTTFLRAALVTAFRPQPGDVPPLRDPGYRAARRAVLLAEIGSDDGKALKWRAEQAAARHIAGRGFSRNQLLNESSALFRSDRPGATEILHEYFVPPDRLTQFLAAMREVVPRHGGDLLNVTIRDVRADADTFLRYADRDLLALVLLFAQDRTPEAEEQMAALTRELIDAALACGGRYYLPYRPHATAEQFHAAYPQARAFFARQRQLDPDGVFRNGFSERYGRP